MFKDNNKLNIGHVIMNLQTIVSLSVIMNVQATYHKLWWSLFKHLGADRTNGA